MIAALDGTGAAVASNLQQMVTVLSANTVVNVTVTGLFSRTTYQIVIVATTLNLQDNSKTFSVTTTAPPTCSGDVRVLVIRLLLVEIVAFTARRAKPVSAQLRLYSVFVSLLNVRNALLLFILDAHI